MQIMVVSPWSDVIKPDILHIFEGAHLLYAKERAMQHVLTEAYSEMTHVMHQFEEHFDRLSREGLPNLEKILSDFNKVNTDPIRQGIVQFSTPELSTNLKSFLLLAKCVVDKVIPMFSYRFGGDLDKFDAKGKKLLNAIKSNQAIKNKNDWISLIESAKTKWGTTGAGVKI